MSAPSSLAQPPTHDTVVTYPIGDTSSTATVVHVARDGDDARPKWAVLLDRTCAHPVDTAWPDQPADRGALMAEDGRRLPLIDVVTGGIRDGALLQGSDLPVRTGTDGWVFVVAHIVEDPPPALGSVVEVQIDADYRRSLSVGHTACHLASLALDAALASAWRKPVPIDALGSPAFDALAIETSRIEPGGSVDVYRIGKSLRRKGFDPGAVDELEAVTGRVNGILATWLQSARAGVGGAVRIERDGEQLSARRRWVCDLPDGAAMIPCGGTHVSHLDEIADITVSLSLRTVEGAVELSMTTRAHTAEGPARTTDPSV